MVLIGHFRAASAGVASGGLAVRGQRGVAAVVAAAAGAAAATPVADFEERRATEKQPIIVIDNYDSFTYNLCQVYIYMVSRVVRGWYPLLPVKLPDDV